MIHCTATLEHDQLTLSTGRIRRIFRWNHGHLVGVSLTDLQAGHTWMLDGNTPHMGFPVVPAVPVGEGTLEVREQAATTVRPAHLAVTVICMLGALEIKRIFRLFPDCPAIPCELYLRGTADGPWRAGARQAGEARNIEDSAQLAGQPWFAPFLERLRLPATHRRACAVLFRDVTDARNNLVREERFIPYCGAAPYDGNLLLVHELLDEVGFFLLREAPCSDVQLAPCGADFVVSRGEITALGIGLDPDDLDPVDWRRGYGVTIGVGQGEEGLLLALRDYQQRRRTLRPDRDEMVLVNTWGDRGQDARIGADFVLRELDACARLGASHLQLDDGWQKGQSSNSASAGGSLAGIWQQRQDYWEVHPTRFPQGFTPIVARARELGIELCLWFNPSADDSYAHWRDDAETLIRYHRAYGIRVFKIDGVYLPDARADRNLRALFDRVVEATDGNVVFNLDVTAGRRWGYHLGVEYGNLFVENRYTDWQNYYPHWTLRNLWKLARYVPAPALQIEFLNTLRNPQHYAGSDPLRPQVVPPAYAFAITMMAQPLGWFEAQHLGEIAQPLAEAIHAYRRYAADLHAGTIFPIGEEPSGISWTGFQSLHPGRGYLLLLREWNERPTANLRVIALAGRTIELTPLLGSGEPYTAHLDSDGLLSVALPAPFSFALYAYTVVK